MCTKNLSKLSLTSAPFKKTLQGVNDFTPPPFCWNPVFDLALSCSESQAFLGFSPFRFITFAAAIVEKWNIENKLLKNIQPLYKIKVKRLRVITIAKLEER